MTAREIRKTFLDFFHSRGHNLVPSAPLVVRDDPTLMFTNAGMNQFKDFFLGHRRPKWRRVANTQRCLRVSGKHNDLEEVGLDTYHHTFFEMLGNWSFGDPEAADGIGEGYFKKESIAWAWELLTSVYKIEKDRLYVTVFKGSAEESLPPDEEAHAHWQEWIAPDRILWGSKKDNFWEMGDTGPCGPCSEIHVDLRTDQERNRVDGASLVNTGHPQVIEIWNLVFIQFNRLADGRLQPLPAKHVDTGMGFERLTRVLQAKTSNYDTDIFVPLISLIESLTGKTYGAHERSDIAFRVLADHVRAISFAIADGQLPSNTGAGYVIRRILRRAVRYYYSFLDQRQPLLHLLIPELASAFADVFPVIQQQESFVRKVVEEEEASFLRTLEAGLRRIAHIEPDLVDGRPTLSGALAFELYDTYGFPLDLTRLIAAEKNWVVDEAGFHREMQRQKERSRKATTTISGDWVEIHGGEHSLFSGYDQTEDQSYLVRYRHQFTKDRQQYQLVLQRTPFYPEGGGQVGDTGLLVFGDEAIEVLDTKKENDLIVHLTERLPQHLDAPVRASVHAQRRADISVHHTATHLLHAALRQVLGTHVQQKGSLVAPDHLRFDFTHFSKVSLEELRAIEEVVNDKIRANVPREVEILPLDEALASGALALFGEKYGERVRVVSFDRSFSRELCGGTHVPSSGVLQWFHIKSETAVAAGVRRIEAVSGRAAAQAIRHAFSTVQRLEQKLGKDLEQAVAMLLSENADLKKKLQQAEEKEMNRLFDALKERLTVSGNIAYVCEPVQVPSAEALKKLALSLKKLHPEVAVALAAAIADKAHLVVALSEALTHRHGLHAAELVKTMSAAINGGGGGTSSFAAAGGSRPSGIPQALALFKHALTEKVA
ncbi:MAG: alanine--tRNA ligase [Chitinophagales bacterium]|nr:alanine--tRNA ligase [Chitinophagales bacterium]MDW8428777.1 alanine--tRNA ligase [Chitinophagales bacterium]